LIAIRGMPGVGKSSLAIKFCNILSAKYPDGNVYLDMRGTKDAPVSPLDAMNYVVRSIRPESPSYGSLEEAQAHYRSLLRERRMLVLLDDVRSGDQIEPLLAGPSVLMVFTTRQVFTMPGLCPVDLDILPPGVSAQFLETLSPRIGELALRIA